MSWHIRQALLDGIPDALTQIPNLAKTITCYFSQSASAVVEGEICTNIIHILGPGTLPRDPDASAVSGIVRVPIELALSQVKEGHRVTVLAVGEESWSVLWRGVRLRSVRPWNWATGTIGGNAYDFRNHLPILVQLFGRNVDVIHGHGYFYFRGFPKVTKIAHFHWDPWYSKNRTIMPQADIEQILRNSHAQIGVSDYIKRQLDDAFGGRGRTVTIANGVTIDVTKIDRSQERKEFRLRYGIPNEVLVFGFAGAIIPEKGVLELAEAFCSLIEDGLNAHVAMAGDWNLWSGMVNESSTEKRYRDEVENILRRGAVKAHMLGKLSGQEMRKFYAGIDVLVVPSVWPESSSLVAREAMAVGRPLIVTNVGGLPELVNPAWGRIVPSEDILGLKNAMLEFVESPARLNQMGRSAQEFAQGWTWDQAAHAVLDVYNKTMRGKRKTLLSHR